MRSVRALDERPELGGTGGEGGGFLVFPRGFVLGGIDELEDGEVHVLAVGEFVLHGVCVGLVRFRRGRCRSGCEGRSGRGEG